MPMSYEVVEPSGPKRRPGTVTTAMYLTFLAFVLLAAMGVAYAVALPSSIDFANDPQIKPSDADTARTVVGIVFGVGFGIVAIVQLVLGIFVGRGRNPARVMTWVVDGLVLLCCGCNLV